MLKTIIKKWWYLLLPLAMANGYCLFAKSPDSTDWQIVDRDTSMKVLAENSQGLAGVKDGTKVASNIQSMHFAPANSPELIIYNFNTKRLCGIGGCLYSIYDNQKLLFRLLAADPTITTQDNCLVISQQDNSPRLKSNKQEVAVIRYCYQDRNYVQQPITHRE
jgi:hypothetical protein